MRAKKVDDNQKILVKHLRMIPGVTVEHTHMIGDGVPDIVVGVRGLNYWLEIKDPGKSPSKRKLTPDEEKWHLKWTGQVAIVETLNDVLKIIKSQ